MQPYLFPYLGYFNLVHASDIFVFLDDVQFIRRGWINRNRIQLGGTDFTFTVPLEKAPRQMPINAMRVSPEYFAPFMATFAQQLKSGYGKAPFFDDVVALVTRVLTGGGTMAELAARSVTEVLGYLSLSRDVRFASALSPSAKGDELRSGARLRHIAGALGASAYLNAPGGRDLYAAEDFASAGLDLRFVAPRLVHYQRPPPFIPGLSVIDALMYLPPEGVADLVSRYDIVEQDRNDD